MDKNLINNIIGTIISTIIVFVFSFLLNSVFAEKSNLIIGSSTKLTDEQYILPLIINSYDSDINNLEITIPKKIGNADIVTDNTINVEQETSTITNTSTFNISNIPKESNFQIHIKSNIMIPDNQISINKNGNKINIKNIDELESPKINLLRSSLITAIVYAILFFIYIYYDQKKREELSEKLEKRDKDYDKNMEFLDNTLKDLREELTRNEEKLKETDSQSKKIQENYQKRQLLLLSKLYDYKKELSFWRDTSRKVLYTLPDNEKKAEKLIESVTKTLKTYRTFEKEDYDFETINLLAKLINEDAKDDKNN